MAIIDTIANEIYQKYLLKNAAISTEEKKEKPNSLVKRPEVDTPATPELATSQSVVTDFIEQLSNNVYDSGVLEGARREPAVDVQMGSDRMYGRYKTPLHIFQAMNRDLDPDTGDMLVRETPSLDYLDRIDIDARTEEYYDQSDRLMVSADATFAFPTPAKPVPDLEVAIDEPSRVEDKELPSAGLGSRPVAEALTDDDMGITDDPVDRDSNFSDTVELLYSDFTKGGQEGTEAHIGQDSQNITLPAGIVADGLIYDGKTVTQGKNSILSKDFDPSKLDTTGAYKIVGDKKIKRSDYLSDVAFSKAVLSAFEDVAKTAAGSSWDSIKEGSKKAVVKIGWNKGPNWLKGDTAKSLYKELSKESPNASSLYSKVLTGSTVKSGGASIGIAKARADSFNSISSLLGVNDITKVTADNTGKNTKFNYYDSEGNLLHTEQTSRSVDIYENGDTEVVQKNSAGKW